MSEQQANRSVGIAYRVTWYVMMLVLVMIIVIEESGLGNSLPAAIDRLSTLYMALIPLALLALAVILQLHKARVSATVSFILFLLWVGLRFLV